MPSQDPSLSVFSCLECKSRKVKCDRNEPTCRRCIKDGAACRYPTERKRPVQMASRPKTNDLERRLVELEGRLRQAEEESSSSSRTSPYSAEQTTTLTRTGRFEMLPPQQQIEELTNLYFTSLWHEAPMMHPTRYIASLYQPPHMQPPMCLQYIIMALAAARSADHRGLAELFYRRARHYMESDEMKEDGHHTTLGHCQAWVLIGSFEAQHLWFSRASMSTSRAVRLAQILGLHAVDGGWGVNQTLLPPKDWCQREERRRTFWTVFCVDRGTSSTTAWPTLIDVSRVQTRLPSSDEAFQSGIEEPSSTLTDALSYQDGPRSAFVCKIVAMHLYNECFESSAPRADLTNPGGEAESAMFWDRYRRLEASLAIALATLPEPMRCPGNPYDANAILINMQLQTAVICLCRAAWSRARAEGGPIPDLDSKVTPAAQHIVTVIALAADINDKFRNPFVAFAGFMAASVFHKDWMHTRSDESGRKLTALLDVMVSVGSHNPGFSAMLAVQLAREMEKTGADPAAMSKVQPLLDQRGGDAPVLGKEYGEASMVVLCPMSDERGRG